MTTLNRTAEASPGISAVGVPTIRGQASYALLLVAAFASTWTGLAVAGIKPSDIALALATLAGAPALLQTRVPRWVLAGSGVLILVSVIHTWLPTSSTYMLERFTLPRFPGVGLPPSTVIVAVQWLVALAILPWLTRAQCRGSVRRVERLLVAWLLGSVTSVMFALSDFLGLSHIAFKLTHGALTQGRQSGLAAHVNHFGFACTMAIPIALFLIARGQKFFGLVALALLVTGSVLSGSRGSQIGAASAIILSAVLTQQGRRLVAPLIWGVTLLATIILAIRPALFSAFTEVIRFGDSTAYASDEARALVARQSIEDIRTHPIVGVGLEVLNQAHSILLETLATGGVVLFIGLLMYYWGALRSGLRAYRDGYVVAGFAVVSLGVFLLMGLIQNQVTDRYLYIPVAAICALAERGSGVRAPGSAVSEKIP